MSYFVLEYNRKTRKAEWTTFEESEPAMASLRVKEACREPDIEVVLLIARDIDVIKRSHSRYFGLPDRRPLPNPG